MGIKAEERNQGSSAIQVIFLIILGEQNQYGCRVLDGVIVWWLWVIKAVCEDIRIYKRGLVGGYVPTALCPSPFARLGLAHPLCRSASARLER